MNWFYNYQISVTKQVNEYDSITGLFDRADSVVIHNIPCDIQPLDVTVDIDTSGKLIDANYKIYLDADPTIDTNCKVSFNNQNFSIVKITDWTDYYILYVKAVI